MICWGSNGVIFYSSKRTADMFKPEAWLDTVLSFLISAVSGFPFDEFGGY